MSKQIRSPFGYEAIIPASTDDTKTIIQKLDALIGVFSRYTELQINFNNESRQFQNAFIKAFSQPETGGGKGIEPIGSLTYKDSGLKRESDSREDLIQMYWIEGMSPTQIMYRIHYGSTKTVIDKLKDYRIPVRGIDTAKQIIEIVRQSNGTTHLRGSILDADAETVTTEAINIKDYQQFQAFISYGETGTATSSTLQITAQYAVAEEIDDNTIWYDYLEGPWSFPIESSATIPINFIITGICLGNFMRFVFTVADNGGTLNATNYFTIDSLHIGVG